MDDNDMKYEGDSVSFDLSGILQSCYFGCIENTGQNSPIFDISNGHNF